MADAQAVAEAIKRIVDLPATGLVSEEDVKNKVVLPMLKAFGYDDADFNYERRTGRGYVDVVVEHFPTGIVVEAKAPRRKLENYLGQLETYVFHKHRPDRATIAILTDGESFNIYGVIGGLYPGFLESYRILSLKRSELGSPVLMAELSELLGKQNNQKGAVVDAIAAYQRKKQDRLGSIEKELQDLGTERERIDAQIQKLQIERTSIRGSVTPDHSKAASGPLTPANLYQTASPHILRLLREQKARSESQGVDRKWLDQQLVKKVEGIISHQAVSHGLIELKKTGQIDYEKPKGRPIKKVWLK
jgi:hypothetical protein